MSIGDPNDHGDWDESDDDPDYGYSAGLRTVHCRRCQATCTWHHTGVRWALMGGDGRLHRCEAGGPAVNKFEAVTMFEPIVDTTPVEPEPEPEPVWKDDGSSLTEVTERDANRYCEILTLLGMEEEGDPVARVRELLNVEFQYQSVSK